MTSNRASHGAWLARLFLSALALSFAMTLPVASQAPTYESPLPKELSSDPDLCAHVRCADVMPEADSFSPRKGQPPYVEAYRTLAGRRHLIGYVFLSTDVVDIPAYSGKPVVTLIGMDVRGQIVGVRILRHSEPILLVGIPESKLTDFIRQYIGKSARDKVEIGHSGGEGNHIAIDAISGATVTVIAENQTIMRSAYEIARQVGLIEAAARPQARLTDMSETLDWAALLREGSVQQLLVEPRELDLPDDGQPYIELHFGYLNAPNIGRSILGEHGYRRLMADLKAGEHAIFVIGRGSASFKGSGFVRGGIYDRVRLTQDADTYTFHDTDYRNLYGVSAAGAPEFRESAIFIIRDPSFSGAYPWQLVFLGNRLDEVTGARDFVNFAQEYWLPARHMEGGRPRLERPDPTWLRIWKARKLEIAAFVLLLLATVAIYVAREVLVRRATRRDKRWVSMPKYLVMAASLGFVGFYAMAQPSVTQVLTWFHSIIYQWKWELFLSDPLIFIFWWFIIIVTFVWGRGLFCGWLCPYGALSELSYRVARVLGLRRFQFALPMRWHDRLKWVKYGVFTGLLAVSFYSMGLAERLAEIEPFKSTFFVGGVWNRSWPFIAYWAVLMGLALLMERPFCKYLCPLGAGLAIPSTFRFFGLKRKPACSSCHACQKGCGSLAIDSRGRIDQRECLLCLDCQILYYDAHSCPPLALERKRRAKSRLPLTPIGADGYFTPVGDRK